MVRQTLVISGIEHENVVALKIPDQTRWALSLKCSCGEQPSHLIYVDADEQVEQVQGKGRAVNLNYKCKLCEKVAHVTVEPPMKLECDVESPFKPWGVVTFDCRGCELLAWTPEEVIIRGPSGAQFKHDLREGDFADFDEEADVPVGLYGVKAAFVVAKH